MTPKIHTWLTLVITNSAQSPIDAIEVVKLTRAHNLATKITARGVQPIPDAACPIAEGKDNQRENKGDRV